LYKEIQHLATKLTNKKQLKNIIFKFDIITVHCFKHKWTQGGEGVRTTQAKFQKPELHPPPLDFQPCASLALNMFFSLKDSLTNLLLAYRLYCVGIILIESHLRSNGFRVSCPPNHYWINVLQSHSLPKYLSLSVFLYFSLLLCLSLCLSLTFSLSYFYFFCRAISQSS
jgi:hypothetical protein